MLLAQVISSILDKIDLKWICLWAVTPIKTEEYFLHIGIFLKEDKG